MSASEWVCAMLTFAAAAAMAVISVRSFRNRGFLLNNAFLYASKTEREKMDKKPYYRQTAIVFLLLSLSFILIGASLVLRESRIFLLEIPLLAGTVLYAVISTVRIQKQEKK